MIVSRAPVRITLGGGGTDLASYYEKFGGFLIAAGINKYIYLAINKRFHPSIRLSYSVTEIVDRVEEIQHNIFREALTHAGVTAHIEIVTVADVPANCGVGSSSSFTVSLLNALHAYKRDFVSLQDLAEEACHIEIDLCREPIGKQDQYMAAFGGLTCLTFAPDGQVTVEPLRISDDNLIELERRILLFYTGVERKASDILREQNEKSAQNDGQVLPLLHKIKEIGLATRDAFARGDLDQFGELMHVHWETKKQLSTKISDPAMDECYDLARRNGALGGKIMGAGGGGFFMFYCPRDQGKLIQAMSAHGLRLMPFRFDSEGAKIIANMR